MSDKQRKCWKKEQAKIRELLKEKMNMSTLETAVSKELRISDFFDTDLVTFSQVIPKPTKKEDNMAFDLNTQAFNRLTSRLTRTKWDKNAELSKVFNMDPLAAPNTFKELKEYLEKGFIKVDMDKYTTEDSRLEDSWRYSLRLEDPSKPKDEAGYDAAYIKMEKAYDSALDIITVKGGDEGLKALQDFESATFH